MSWKSDKAIERLVKTFKRAKNQIFEQDVEAIKTINETIEVNEKQYVTDNILFAKLLCYVLNGNLHKTGDMKSAIRVASGILDQPLTNHLDILHRNLNSSLKCRYLESIGVEMFELTDNTEIIEKNKEEMFKKLFSDYSFDSVSKSFYNTVNEFLRDTNNYV